MQLTLDSLEAIALKNRLDLEVIMFKQSDLRNNEFRRETISLLSDRYKKLTGKPYFYDERIREVIFD